MRVVEYILAFVIVASFIPMFNTMIHTYYTVEPIRPPEKVLDIVSDTVITVLHKQYGAGNFTPEIIDFDGEVVDTIGEDLYLSYGYRVLVYSSITNITVDDVNELITVRTIENYTLHLYIFFSDSTWRQVDVEAAEDYVDGEYLYRIPSSSIGGSVTYVEVIVAILESTTSRYVGYWFRDPSRVGYVLNINGLTVLVGSGLNLQPIEFYGHTVYNVSIVFYNDIDRKYTVYGYIHYNLSDLGGRVYVNETYNEVYVNKHDQTLIQSHILYVANISKSFQVDGYKAYPVEALRIDIPVYQVYQCYDPNFSNCEFLLEDVGDPVSSTEAIGCPIYNAVLLVLESGSGNVYVPVYRQRILIGEESVPEKVVVPASYYVRIGMFDYNVLAVVWRRWS